MINDEWQVEERTGWIPVPGFGKINPRPDNVAVGRQYFTAQLDNGEYARATGEAITEGQRPGTTSSINLCIGNTSGGSK